MHTVIFLCPLFAFLQYSSAVLNTMASTGTDPTILSSKRAVYVGGLAPGVNRQLLRAAMIPFGNVKSLDIVRTIEFVVVIAAVAVAVAVAEKLSIRNFFSLVIALLISDGIVPFAAASVIANGLCKRRTSRFRICRIR